MQNYLIAKSNSLIEASYSISINEQRVLLSCISQINSFNSVDPNKPFKVNIEQIQNLFFKENPKDAYKCFKYASKKLSDRKFTIFSKDGEKEIYTSIIQTIYFNKEETEVSIFFSIGVLPFLSSLRENFTQYRLNQVTRLTSTYSIRIYEMIVSWYNKGDTSKEITIKKLKLALNLLDKYKHNKDFRVNVTNLAQTQINEHTDFNLEIDFKKRGRSFHSLDLRFNKKEKHQKLTEANDRKLSHLSKERQKQIEEIEVKKAEKEKERQKKLFDQFCLDYKLIHGMKLIDSKTQKEYEYIHDNQFVGILTRDYPKYNKYFLSDEHVLQLLFLEILQEK